MSNRPRIFEKVWTRAVGLLIFFLLFLLGDYVLGSDGLEKLVNNVSYVLLVLMIPVFGYLLWQSWQIHLQKSRVAHWKQRIQQIADRTDAPYEDFTFDDFCELTDDSELERTIEFLEQMPQGRQNVNEAYAKVLAKYGGPI